MSANSGQPVTVAKLGIPARIMRILVGLLLSWLGCTMFFIATTSDAPGDADLPIMLGVGLVATWPGLCMLLRNLHAFMVKPTVILSPAGIHVRRWQEVGFRRFLLPYHRIETWAIPWNAYQGTQVFTQSTNSIPTSKELFIFTERGKLSIPWGMFNLSVERLQGVILDYREIEFRLPQRIAAGLVDFQKRRFAEPVIFRSRTTPLWVPVGLAAVAVGITIYANGLEDRKFASSLVGWTWFIGAVAVWITANDWWKQRNQGHIELRADGLVVAASAGSGRPVPWEDVLFARACTKASHWGYGASDQNAPGVLEAVEIRFAGGRSVRVCAPSAPVLDRLHGLLEPPLDRLLVAKQRIAAGESIEAAAKAAGLMTRT